MNNQYWSTKISRNRERDGAKSRELRKSGITVIRFWEHELTSDLPKCVARIKRVFRQLRLLGKQHVRQISKDAIPYDHLTKINHQTCSRPD